MDFNRIVNYFGVRIFIYLVLYNISSIHLDYLCIELCFILEVRLFLLLIIGFNLRKIFKAYYGFRVLYLFPFPSVGHGPTGSGRDIKFTKYKIINQSSIS